MKGAFLDFLNMLSENSEWLNLDILDQMYGIIDRFELFPQYGAAKSMIIEPVTSDFYLFFILFMSHEFFLPELLERNIDDIFVLAMVVKEIIVVASYILLNHVLLRVNHQMYLNI